MKNTKSIQIALAVVACLCLAFGVYALVLSIKGEGNYALTIALFLIALGNFITLIGNKLRKK